MAEEDEDIAESFAKLSINYLLVAAFDFGTTYSGFSFSVKDRPDKIYAATDWGEALDILSAHKAPTCILTNTMNKFEAFGHEARKKFAVMQAQQTEKYRFFEDFKMKLHNEKNLDTSTEIEDHRGDKFPAIDIFAMVLVALKEEMFGYMKRQVINVPANERIRWVVTVPAIWTTSAIKFMKDAAVKAELVKSADAENLLIALEPKAASIWCRKLAAADFAVSTGESSEFSVGSQYIIMDAGGGTLDVAAHEMLQNKQLGEIYVANGGPMGAIRLKKDFLNLLDKMFDHKFTELYKKKDPGDFLSFMNRFEARKKAFNPLKQEQFAIKVSSDLDDIYYENFKKKFRESIKKEYALLGVNIGSGHLRIPLEVILNIFKPVVSEILDHVKDILKKKNLAKVKTILMVGGFSDCIVLQEEMKKEFGDKYRILIPREAWLVIMKGAVRFGQNTNVVAYRVSRKTYGTSVSKVFDPTLHDPNKKKTINGVERAVKLFDIIVPKDQRVALNTTVRKVYYPVRENQFELRFPLCETHESNPRYVDDKNVEQDGLLKVNIPGSGPDRKVELIFKFLGTEIDVQARDMRKGGTVVRTNLYY